jgi:hypothetical protein
MAKLEFIDFAGHPATHRRTRPLMDSPFHSLRSAAATGASARINKSRPPAKNAGEMAGKEKIE